VHGVGVTISEAQAEVARKRVADAGLADRIEIRVLDYRDIDDGPFDAISSIGMFEHVGAARLTEYFGRLTALLRPGGRLLNHGISRPPIDRVAFGRRAVTAATDLVTRSRPVHGAFVWLYVFPDGELHEVGNVISTVQDAGLEVRHVESLREHYAITLRRWVANLEARWDDAVTEVGEGRARVWRLYMAGSAVSFEMGRTSVHQVLAVRPDGPTSGMPLRPDWRV
jgi:cyclopropane-fatty-acyl-phospholipid synthase